MVNVITVVDYGVGNLKSVVRALAFVGADVVVTNNPGQIMSAERLLLPGVGAFGHCMGELERYRMVDALREYKMRERPLLGICVGMQLLLERSEEFGEHKGLGFIAGSVKKIPVSPAAHERISLPAIGWMKTQVKEPAHPLFAGMTDDAYYYVHSFMASGADAHTILACYDYHGIEVTAGIADGHVMGVQFHPEKSGPAGLALLSRYILM